jgi:hypothetical protein
MKTKKELKEQYKNQIPQMGVFEIRNTANQKILLDTATNIPSKWNRHRIELRFGNHRNRQLQEDWNEFGEEKFICSVLSELKLKEDDNSDIKSELKLLQSFVEEELNIVHDMTY